MSNPKEDERTPDNEKIVVEVVSGRAGPCLCFNDRRVAGPKPWGGGQVVYKFHVDQEEFRALSAQACNSFNIFRGALELIEGGFEGEGLEIENEWRRSVARAALNGVTQPASDADKLEEIIVAAYKRGFMWCVANSGDPEAVAYLGKAARDYADYTMNAPSTEVEKISTDTEVRG